MNKYNLVCIVLVWFGLIGSTRAQQSFHLNVDAKGTPHHEIEIILPVENRYFPGNAIYRPLSDINQGWDGEFPLEKTTIVTIVNNYREVKLIVSSGDDISIKFFDNQPIRVSGSNAEGQLLAWEANMYYKLLLSTDLFFTCRPRALGYEDYTNRVNLEYVAAWMSII